jgi:RNA polymerase sigma factor (sigma-70 family)
LLNETPDERLLARAAEGDVAAFRLIYERHRDALFRFSYRLTNSVEAAEDITHDCFLNLLEQPARFDAGRATTLRAYLFGAARNLALKRWRDVERRRDAQDLEEVAENAATERDLPLRRLLDEELAAVVGRAIEKLSPLQREVLALFEYENCSLAEIAEIVGADVNTVKARLHRARGRLRMLLAPYLNGASDVDKMAVAAEERR